MQHIQSNRNENDAPLLVRTDLSSLLSNYTNAQRRYNNRLESLERDMANLKGQVKQSYDQTGEHELNRTFTTKKTPTSARVMSPSRIPVPITPRQSSTNESSTARTLPIVRSKSFHNSTSPSTTDDANLLRTYKLHLEQTLQKKATPYSDTKVPNYNSIDDVIKSNEQLLLENDRLHSELNRMKAESVVLLRSMRTTAAATTTAESNFGNERIIAERERQELTMELARQIEENKRLRKALLAQSTKFLSLRQSTTFPDNTLTASIDHRQTPNSAPQTSRSAKSKSARVNAPNRTFVRAKTFYGSNEPM